MSDERGIVREIGNSTRECALKNMIGFSTGYLIKREDIKQLPHV